METLETSKVENETVCEIGTMVGKARAYAKDIVFFLHNSVESLIIENSKDNLEIEKTLDFLMGPMVLGEGKEDFMKLALYYLKINKDGANYYHNSALKEGLLTQMEHLEELTSLNLSCGEYTIFGGGPLAARGIRPNVDIDLIVTPRTFDKLLGEYGKNKRSKIIRIGNIEIFPHWNPYFLNIPSLRACSEKIGDFSYVRLSHVLNWKRQSKRKKDVKDVRLIDEYLSLWQD